MDKSDFKRWRKSLDLSQKDAAQKLGLKRRVVQYYEKGERDGKKVDIPLSVRLACWAIAQGQEDYHGPVKKREKAATDAAAEETVSGVIDSAAHTAETPAGKKPVARKPRVRKPTSKSIVATAPDEEKLPEQAE